MTLALYARRKEFPLTGITVRLEHSRVYATDCAECETKEGKVDRIEREIVLEGALTAEQRETAKKNYQELIATAGFPDKPDGSKMVYRTAVKVGVVFAEAKNKARAKEFVQFLLQEENLTPYVEGALGRWFPVTKAGQARPFWQNDRHRKAVFDQYAAGTVTFEFTRNYKFTILNNENVWAKAANRVLNEKIPVDKAVDEMIARIKQVAG